MICIELHKTWNLDFSSPTLNATCCRCILYVVVCVAITWCDIKMAVVNFMKFTGFFRLITFLCWIIPGFSGTRQWMIYTLRLHSHWYFNEYLSQYGLFKRIKHVRVEWSVHGHSYMQTLVIQSPLEIWWKLSNTLNFLQKFNPRLPVMLYVAVWSTLYVIYVKKLFSL